MVDRGILCLHGWREVSNVYDAVMSILGNAINNWTEFDAWCLVNGFNPLEVPSRRLVAAAWAFLIKDMDPETIDQLVYDLTVRDSFKEVKKTVTVKAAPESKKAITSRDKWKAPDGWTPPGWNEEKSYQTSMQFMGFNANPK